ncbi:Golgi CORVET complex core vacuolar protein 8-domain-containing protein [Lipomyces oligophaga]|uniref:Golgi CORVET complex core vacuolar protein 8-domain-containing protein n=1 Tax=Lipomyces oligophaga TaxID=45792 RepID=UPI0034CF511B
MSSTSDFLLSSPPLRPFDLRFHTRHESPAFSLRSSSPSGSFAHSSRISSISVNFEDLFEGLNGDDQGNLPWEVIRWTKLRKLSSQIYSDIGKQQFGAPTCIAISSTIALGTAKGYILIFDFNQNMLCALGSNVNVAPAGAVTSLCFSHDHTYIASGHEHGHIYSWHIKRPMAPRIHISPYDPLHPDSRHDGHVQQAKILHIGFMGKRHSIIASADDKGMAFLHVSLQQIVGKQLQTTRLVGRYPSLGTRSQLQEQSFRQRKATSVLAFAPMPLGINPHPLENRGLIALMTPHILVVLSTSPTAQTQIKIPRPKTISDTMGLSGCMDWFPAVALPRKGTKKSSNLLNGIHPSNPRLAYCWSNVVTILDLVSQSTSTQSSINKGIKEGVAQTPSSTPPINANHIDFIPAKTYEADEAVVALRWLTSQIIVMVTITQRLLILNEVTMSVTDVVDLVPRQIMHHDYFSAQLSELVIRNSQGAEHYATIPDAFFNSFKTFKGRIFLLGTYEFAVGHLSSWEERLDSLLEANKFAEAIRLVTKYYNGETDRVTIGLPESEDERHHAVRDKLIESVLTALKFILDPSGSSTPPTPVSAVVSNATSDELEQLQVTAHYRQTAMIAEASFEALFDADALDILFDSVYEYFENANLRGIYFETLEGYILSERIISLPPPIVKEMINIYAYLALNDRLEEIICHLDTRSLDIDQVSMLCRTYELYDALIYVWNQALDDYISPLSDFLKLITKYFDLAKKQELAEAAIDDEKQVVREDNLNESVADDDGTSTLGGNEDELSRIGKNIAKVYSYLSYIFTGRLYPTGSMLESGKAESSKSLLYWFLFLGSIITWPRQHGSPILISDQKDDKLNTRSFPYLRLLLQFDAAAFVAVMNEAFENSFLNGEHDELDEKYNREDLPDDIIFGQMLTRQYIINILLEILSGAEFTSKETIYLDMFIARSVAKYAQFISLSDEMMHGVLLRLCKPPSPEIADDCQLSVEYLLSIYRPLDLEELVKIFFQARYFRVLRWLFRTEKLYARLVSVFFEDSEDSHAAGEPEEVFDTIESCLSSQSDLTEDQRKEVCQAISQNFRNLVLTDAGRAATVVERFMPELHSSLYEKLQDRRDLQFRYLKALFSSELRLLREGGQPMSRRMRPKWNTQQARETYVTLLCEFDKSKVIQFLRYLQKGDLRLSKVLSALELAGVIDGEIFLLRSEGQYVEAIRRLAAHLKYLTEKLLMLYPDTVSRGRTKNRGPRWVHVDEKKLADVERALQHYAILGTRLCTERAKKPSSTSAITTANSDEDLSETEQIWLDLIDSVVTLTREVSTTLFPDITVFERASRSVSYDSPTKTLLFLRRLVQDVFSSLLAATSTTRVLSSKNVSALTSGGGIAPGGSTSFLRVLEVFLARTAAASPSVVDLRNVLANIFEAYIYERQLLSLTNRLLSKDLMVHVASVYRMRQQGWRVSNPICEVCGKKIWGESVVNQAVSEAWDRKLINCEKRRQARFRGIVGTAVNDVTDHDKLEDEYRPGRVLSPPNSLGRSVSSDGIRVRSESSLERNGGASSSNSSKGKPHYSNSAVEESGFTEVEGFAGSGNEVLSTSANGRPVLITKLRAPKQSSHRTHVHHYGGAAAPAPHHRERMGSMSLSLTDAGGSASTSNNVNVQQTPEAVLDTGPAAHESDYRTAWVDVDDKNRLRSRTINFSSKEELDSLVMFKCKHVYHRNCLEKILSGSVASVTESWLGNGRKIGEGYRCIICH